MCLVALLPPPLGNGGTRNLSRRRFLQFGRRLLFAATTAGASIRAAFRSVAGALAVRVGDDGHGAGECRAPLLASPCRPRRGREIEPPSRAALPVAAACLAPGWPLTRAMVTPVPPGRVFSLPASGPEPRGPVGSTAVSGRDRYPSPSLRTASAGRRPADGYRHPFG